MRRQVLATAGTVLVIATGAVAAAHGTPSPSPCTGSALSGTLAGVPGSAGAGQISYNLRLHNRSARACFVSGLPVVRLLGRTGTVLPTHVVPSHPGQLTAVRVVLAANGYAAATARFSPDVPGVGEPATARQCEPTAYRARVQVPPSGRTVTVPLVPPTPVCEHGRMVFSVLVAGRHGPATG
jgi:hypothetical protein